MFNAATRIINKLSKMSKEELLLYREKYSLNQDEDLDHNEDTCKGESTACCSHNHHKKKSSKPQTEEEVMQEFVDKQRQIRENNMKPTGGGWIIP